LPFPWLFCFVRWTAFCPLGGFLSVGRLFCSFSAAFLAARDHDKRFSFFPCDLEDSTHVAVYYYQTPHLWYKYEHIRAHLNRNENVEHRPRRRLEVRSPSSRHLYWQVFRHSMRALRLLNVRRIAYQYKCLDYGELGVQEPQCAVADQCWHTLLLYPKNGLVKPPRRDVTHEPSAQPACSEERRRSA
jgi:hypothetical protein